MNSTPHGPTPEERTRDAKRVTLLGAVVNLLLTVAKVSFGLVGHSQSLVADGVHSLSDLLSDAVVWFAAHHGGREADEEHPYGHARIETAASVAMGVLLIAVAAGILYDAVDRLFDTSKLLIPGWLALVVAALSVAAKEALYRYTVLVARRLRSPLLRANAWHHRTDAVSSVVVLVGVGGTMAGLPYLDAIAAAGVSLMIAHVGWELGWHALRELVDTGLEQERVEAIRRSILAVPGVEDLHLLRTRRMGGDALVDVHILLADPRMSVSEGHQISETVRHRVIDEVEEVADVMVHIDPEDDSRAAPCARLPLRDAVLARLDQRWADIDAALRPRQVTLHYINGRIHLDVTLPMELAADPEQARRLARRLAAALDADEVFGELKVLFG
jgi:cation diffusion facilitator family transporter